MAASTPSGGRRALNATSATPSPEAKVGTGNETHLRLRHRPGHVGGPGGRPGDRRADPGTRPMDYQQATDIVVMRGLSQRGVPFSWAGGGVNGPTRGTGTGINTVGFDASGLMQYAYAGAGTQAAAFLGRDLPGRPEGPAAAGTEGRPDLLRPRGHAKRRDVPREQPDARGRRRRAGFAGAQQRHDALPGPGPGSPDGAGAAGADPASSRRSRPGAASTGAAIAGQQLPGQQAPLQQLPTQQAPAQQLPGQQAPGSRRRASRLRQQQAPAQQQAPLQQAPAQQQAPLQQLPSQQVPLQQVPTQQAPLQQTFGTAR